MAATPPSRILIVKLSSMGDVIHALPVPGSLRASLPHARLAWVVEKKWLPLIEHHPDLDQVFTVDSYGLRQHPHRWSDFRASLEQLRAFQPDCALDLQGTLKSAWITRSSHAPFRIGFATPVRRERLAGLAYNASVIPQSAHIVEQLLDLAAAAAAPAPLQRRLQFPFPVPAPVQQEVDAWIADNHLGEFAFVSPGGGWASKRWPSERYAALAEMLQTRFGLTAVLNRGPGEREMDDAYRRANQIRARLFSGDVLHLAAILRRARLVVGGDTGPLQLAAALATPTIALFGPTDPARNGPYSPLSRVLRKTSAVSYKRGSTYSPSMLAITPDEVAQVCGEVLQTTPQAGQAGPIP